MEKIIQEFNNCVSNRETKHNINSIKLANWGHLAKNFKNTFESLKSYVESSEKVDKEVAERLIKLGYYPFVIHNIDKFDWLNRKTLLNSALRGWRYVLIAENIDKFDEVNYNTIADKLIEKDQNTTLLHNLSKFKRLNSNIAIKLIKCGCASYIVDNFDNFYWLEKDVAVKLIESWYCISVINNKEKFKWISIDDLKQIEIKVVKNIIKNNKGENSKIIDDLLEKYDNNVIADALRSNKEYTVLWDNLHKFKFDEKHKIRYTNFNENSLWGVASPIGARFLSPNNQHPLEDDSEIDQID